jgi:hypothetical protein
VSNTDPDDDPKTDHYFNDSDGDLWVNLSNTDSVTLDLIDTGEVLVGVTEIAVSKQTGSLLMVVDTDGQAAIDEYATSRAPEIEHTTDPMPAAAYTAG